MKANTNEIKNAKVTVTGFVYDDDERTGHAERLECIITNDRFGKTLSINDGKKQFTIPFEAVEKYLK